MTRDVAEAVAGLSKYICLFSGGPQSLRLTPGPELGCQMCTSGPRPLGAEYSPSSDASSNHLPSIRGQRLGTLCRGHQGAHLGVEAYLSLWPLWLHRAWQGLAGMRECPQPFLWTLQRRQQWGYPTHFTVGKTEVQATRGLLVMRSYSLLSPLCTLSGCGLCLDALPPLTTDHDPGHMSPPPARVVPASLGLCAGFLRPLFPAG